MSEGAAAGGARSTFAADACVAVGVTSVGIAAPLNGGVGDGAVEVEKDVFPAHTGLTVLLGNTTGRGWRGAGIPWIGAGSPRPARRW